MINRITIRFARLEEGAEFDPVMDFIGSNFSWLPERCDASVWARHELHYYYKTDDQESLQSKNTLVSSVQEAFKDGQMGFKLAGIGDDPCPDEEVGHAHAMLSDGLPDGKVINDSFSTCAPHVKASLFRIYKYDQEFRSFIRLSIVLICVFIGLCFLSINLYMHGRYILGTLAALPLLLIGKLSLKLIVMLPLGLKMAKEFYYNALLTPAIIIKDDPIRLACLANMSNGLGDESFGLKIIEVAAIPEHKIERGEMVPCVSTFQAGEHVERWSDFNPKPISWGTGDRSEIQRCAKKIDSEEIEKLKRLLKTITPMEKVDQLVIYDKDLNKIPD